LGFLLFLGAGWGVFKLGDSGETPSAQGDCAGLSCESAAATPVSALAQALTEIAPTPTVSPTPTVPPTATPEPIIDESTGASMVFIPGGIFQMGGNDEADDDDMQPLHRVSLDPYFIDLTEVTNGQYATCVDAGVCTPPQSPNATYHPTYYGDENYTDYPVIFVNWNQAQQFCDWRGGRLPTEAEWEFAAGYRIAAAEKTTFPWGNVMPEAVANFCDANCSRDVRDPNYDDQFADTAPVTAFEAGRSPFGLYNMSGNVMEWVFDWYDPDYYAESTEINPSGPLQGTARVLRGGSWYNTLESLEVSRRGSYVPEVARATLGFRCARIVE
jgi:formylglycine-generating enzyme required for sulfatase activity